MMRHLAIPFVVATAACQAVTGSFAVGAGETDSGATSNEGSTGTDGSLDAAGSSSGSGGSGSSGGSSGSSSGSSGGSSGSGSGSSSGSSGSSGGGDAGQDACATNAGTGAVGTLDCPCSTADEPACNGNAQKLALLCSGGVWVPNGECASGQLCDSQLGSNQGTCQPLDPACASATPGQDVCSNATTAVQCGPDLLSDSPVATCTNQACVSGACTGVCTPGATQCTSNTQVETCGSNGQWATTTCPDACVNGSCGGVCAPGATQGCSYWDVGCGCDVGGSQTCGSNGQWGGCG